MSRKQPENCDWVALRRDYEAKTYSSVRALAAAYGVSHTRIQQRAKKEGWTASLAPATAQARQRSSSEREPGPAAVLAITTMPAPEAAQAVQTAAAMAVQVVRQHRVDIRRATTLVDGLEGYLQLAIETNPPETALQVDGLAETMERLVRTRERLQRMERAAFGLTPDKAPDADEGDKAVLSLTDEQKEALRAALQARFARQTVDSTAEEVEG